MSDRERPKPRERPRPAPDNDQDPILPNVTREPQALPPAPASAFADGPALPQANRGAIPTVQLNTRVAPEIDAMVTAVAADRGWTKRQVIEYALKVAYPKEAERFLAS